MALWLIVVGIDCVVADPPQHPGKLHMPPAALVANLSSEVRNLFIVPDAGRDRFVDQSKIACVDIVGDVLKRNGRLPAALVPERPADLRIADEDHACWSPVI